MRGPVVCFSSAHGCVLFHAQLTLSAARLTRENTCTMTAEQR